MEFHTLYQWASMAVELFTKNEKWIKTLGVGIGSLLWLGLFFLQGAGLYVMAKRCGLKKRGLAFVPFANIFYLGKIVGECSFFGQRMKRAGLYAMLAQILATVVTVLFVLAEWYLYYNYVPVTVDNGFFEFSTFPDLTGFAAKVYKFYDTSSLLMSFFGLIAEILLLILMIGMYKKYSPANYRFLGILTFFFPVARFIAVFVFRNRQSVNYEEYMRRQYEEYMRRQQQYYNTYGNPYNNPYGGGYNRGNVVQPPNQPPQNEPFDEFSSEEKGGEPFDEFPSDEKNDDGGDDFFN